MSRMMQTWRGRPAAVAVLLAVMAPAANSETLTQRGAYLVNGIMNCGNCHSPQTPDGALAGAFLSGGPAIPTPVFTAYPPNITPDAATGIGGWTEAEIVTALREGRTPDGRILRPPMPVGLYRVLSDRDASAVAAYLKSLPPTVNKVPQASYRSAVPARYGPPLDAVSDPDPADRIAYGAYLVRIGHCMQCHTPLDSQGQRDDGHRLGAGGLRMDGVFGTVITPNITPDVETGIGGWNDTEIRAALTKGLAPGGRTLSSPMPSRYLATMHRDDVDAVIAYLHTLPSQHQGP